MRKFVFNFVFAFVLGVLTTIWFISPGEVKGFIADATKEGAFNLPKLQKNADWAGAEQKVLSGAQKTVDAVSEWDMFNSLRAKNYVNEQVK